MSKNTFPAVITQMLTSGGEAEAVFGLALKSMLKGDLFFDNNATDSSDDNSAISVHQQKMTMLREGLLHAISAWPETLTLELLITSLPNLQFNAQGRVLITIVLRIRAKTELKARQ